MFELKFVSRVHERTFYLFIIFNPITLIRSLSFLNICLNSGDL